MTQEKPPGAPGAAPPAGRGSEPLTVFVEETPIRVWPWSRVRHALLRYSEEELRRVRRGEAVVVDGAGNRLDPEGALDAGARLYLRRTIRSESDPSASR